MWIPPPLPSLAIRAVEEVGREAKAGPHFQKTLWGHGTSWADQEQLARQRSARSPAVAVIKANCYSFQIC